MTNQEIINKITEAIKGRYINFTKEKDLGKGVRKETDMKIRLGVKYANMSINQGRDTGSLPWGHWVPNLSGLVIEHSKTDKKTKKVIGPNYYLRVTSCTPEHPDSGADILATRFYKDGREISREEAIVLVGEKKVEDSVAPVKDVKFENIIKIGK